MFGLWQEEVYDSVKRIVEAVMARVSDEANAFVKSDECARIIGSVTNSTNAATIWLGDVFPLVPNNQAKLLTETLRSWEQLAVATLGIALESLRPDPHNLIARWRAWWGAVTTPYPIAQTPKHLIWQQGIVKLYRYRETVSESHHMPLLLVFAIMNAPWIFDLAPGRSFVEYMLGEGYDVYLVDWGSPTTSEQHWTLETYALELLPCIISEVKRLSKTEGLTILGWCLGAVISSIYAAMRPNDGLKNLILLTPPLDFSSDDLRFKKQLKYLDVELLLRANGGLMDADMIDMGAQMLRPFDNTIATLWTLWLHALDREFVESWRAMSTWLKIVVPISGDAYWQIVALYLDNLLTRGEFRTSEGAVNLATVQASLLMLVSRTDGITPPVQAVRALPCFGSPDKTLLEINKGGHIGAMAGGVARTETWPMISGWLAPRDARV